MNPARLSWPVCGKCCDVAWFPWMGGPHHCVVAAVEEAVDDSALDVVGLAITLPGWPPNVRRCPGVHVPGDARGLHQLICAVIDAAVGEALAVRATVVEVTLIGDGGVQVDLNAGSIAHAMDSTPVDDSRAQAISVLSSWSARFELELRRDGDRWFQCFDRGVPGTVERGPRTTTTGMILRFWPEPAIFGTATADGFMLARRLHEIACLINGLTIRLNDQRPKDDDVARQTHDDSHAASQLKVRTFHYPGGLVEYIARINRIKTPIHSSVVHFQGKGTTCDVEVVMQWNAGYSESVHTFANTIRTQDGGTHEEGFRAALTSVVNRYAKDHKLLRRTEPDLTDGDIGEGLAAVVSVQLAGPLFEGQQSARLANVETKAIVQATCRAHLARWFDANPIDANAIVRKAILSADARRMPRWSHCR